MPRLRHPWWLLAGLSFMIAASALAIVEAVLRHRHPEATLAAVRLRIEREVDTRWRPDERFHHVADGFFELDFPRADEGSAPRILIVGDSFAMGHGVGIEHRFGTVLEAGLGGRHEVDVLAVSSYSPIIYRNIVREALGLQDYAVAAVFVDQTDPADEVIYRNDLVVEDGHEFDVPLMLERKAIVDETYRTIRLGLSGWRGWPRHSAILNLLRPSSLTASFPKDNRHYRYVRLELSRGRLVQAFEEQPQRDATRRMESFLFQHLDEIVEMCGARGVPLILAANPWEYQVSDRPRVGRVYAPPYPRENRLEGLLRQRYGGRQGIQVLELTRVFRQHRDPSGLFLDRPRNEIHWNRAGHALVGRALLESLPPI